AGMHTRAVALLQLETDLRWAIDREEFELYYQPIISLESGRIGGFEALIRWKHPERGLVSPIDFIPVAEETGWIVPIGRWVLEQACSQLALWHQNLPTDIPITMSVNLSGKQFSQPDLITSIEDLLARHQIPPGCLKLEITESSIMENAEAVTERLLRLRAIGVKLGLDDFGTGYSSLSYLHRFPLDTLKIDRSFIARMNEDGENREIVRTILSLGKNLGMEVVAEGVEEIEQLVDLRNLDCKHGQGYFFARPLTSDQAQDLLSSTPSW
ncbi:EAL domain-containing protein, partial [bacterium]